jgi:TP901 family phage tail tape measure protein
VSEFLGEARVVIRPDTTQFRAVLEAEIAAVTKKPVVIPVTAAVTGTTTGATGAASAKAETAKQAEAKATQFLEKSELALVAAQEKALLTTTQLGAARARLTGAVQAVAAAEKGLAAAERSKNAELIEAAQTTLALAEAEEIRARGVARTVILANAQAAALAKTTAAEADATKSALARAGAEAEVAGVQRAVITATAAATKSTGELAAVQALAAKSANDLATAELRTMTVSTELGAAQIRAASAVRVAANAQEALVLSLARGNAQLIQASALTALLANANEAEALAALSATRAQNAHAASLGNVNKAAIASGAGFLGLRGAVLTAGAGFIAATVAFQALARSIGLAAQLETELNVFRVTAGATADQMERVSEAATQLGRDITLPGVNAQDAAETMSQLARAGLDVEDSMAAARGTLQLATAAEIDNAQATELVANALNSFKLEGEDATRVADLFAGAAKESQGSIVDMGLALKQASAIASGLGISIEDTITLLTQLSRAGLSSSDAGTSLRQTFLRLIQNLPRVNDEVKKLGLNLRDASGNIRPEIFEELGTKLRKLTPAARQAAIANLGGADAIRTYLLLSREAVGTFDEVQASITQQGLASEAAAARTSGLTGDVEAAKNELTALGTTLGEVASGPLSFFARTAGLAAGAINDMNREIEESNAPRELSRSLGDLFNVFERVNLSFRAGVQGATNFGAELHTLDGIAAGTTTTIEALANALQEASDATAATQGTPQDEGLGVQQVLNRVSGFDSAETRAKIRGDTDELLSVLQAEQDFLRAQLERQFVQNRPALRDQLQQALLGSIQEAEGIAKSGAAEAKRATAEAARAAKEAAAELARAIAAADQELLSTLGNRREDAERRAGPRTASRLSSSSRSRRCATASRTSRRARVPFAN